MSTWNYSGDPSTSEKDAVRFLIQDTNTSKQLFQDSEIYWTLTQEMNIYTAAAALCDVLVAKAGGVKGKKISEFAIQYDPMFYRTLAGTLRARGAGHQLPYAGGISIADKQAQQGDPDWVAPSFARGLDQNSQAPSPASPANGGSGTNGNPLTDSN